MRGTRLESERYVLAFAPPAVEVGRHFGFEFGVCAKPGQPMPESLRVDATMPDHRHGMNYAPSLAALGPGRWRAEGFLFHMPGRWQFAFELRAAGRSDVLSADRLVLSSEEKAKILAHGPWPPPLVRDPSNRASGKPEAVALGARLFFDPGLSGNGAVLCATCHVPFRAFQDARPRGVGLQEGDRNTPTLLDVRFQRWFGWDGANDSLWAQSLRPLVDPKEMGASVSHVARALRTRYAADYRKAFGRAVPASDQAALVDAGKALAAFQETLVSPRTPFDEFRDALARGDEEAAARYPLAAQRGLLLFVGRGNCAACHFGPQFTNGEFGDVGIGYFVRPGEVDSGRHGGIERLKKSPYNLLGRFSDDRSAKRATGTRHLSPQHRNFGEFKVPGLRNVARTAPYMHNGSLATLRDVVRHYSELNEERLHTDGEKILRPLKLYDDEVDDLVAFLESLSSDGR